jgi:hypothetical protein
MRINFIRQTTVNRLAALLLLTCCFFQLPSAAQSPVQANERTKVGTSVPLGLARGEMLRFTAFNPGSPDEGGEPIRMQMKLYDAHGSVIAESAEVVIPPGEFRFVDFNRDDLPLAGEPGTGRLQVRTVPLWGFRSRNRISVSTSLEVVGSSTNSGSFKFFFTVEALP